MPQCSLRRAYPLRKDARREEMRPEVLRDDLKYPQIVIPRIRLKP